MLNPKLPISSAIGSFCLKLLSVGVAGTMFALPADFLSVAQADCQTSYKEAMTLLDTTTKKASQNEHPNPDSFSTEFKSIVGTMQSQKCMSELMSLIQHIQSEQQKLPGPTIPVGKDDNSPITD